MGCQSVSRISINREGVQVMAVAAQVNLAKSEFLSSMSHELRTPLGAILGFAQLIESGSPAPTISQKKSVDQILKAGWYLLDLINEILDLAQIESGKLSWSLEPVSLTELMQESRAMIEPLAQRQGIRMAFSQVGLPYFVTADRTRLKQVLINLLSNAVKYNKVGGTVLVDCVATTPERVRICVRDTGEGLDALQLTQLLQPLNRLGQEESAERGSGIGLVVCKRLIELMGGVMDVDSELGRGSVFCIELELARDQLAAATRLKYSSAHTAHVITQDE
jgi:signal transduction histidine kinase